MIQINGGCAVNADWTDSYAKDTVVMKNGKKLLARACLKIPLHLAVAARDKYPCVFSTLPLGRSLPENRKVSLKKRRHAQGLPGYLTVSKAMQFMGGVG